MLLYGSLALLLLGISVCDSHPVITCTTTARDARFTSLTSFEVTCPSDCVDSNGNVWGSIVYTHDSSICRAAIHDGRLNDSGGEITVYKQPGQSSYTGVERNSVTSSSYGSWGSSFSFRQTIPDRSITCTTTARDARFTSQNSFAVTCPSGCVQSDGNIWGSAVYTHDSSICRAAIHDGRLTDNGGVLTVFRQSGQSSYTGIERNSITSSSYGAWDSSFTFTSEIPNGFSIICTTTARDARFTSLTSFEVTCPSGCVESSGSLWGNVVYTHDSSICRAAIHDGRLNDSGGEITVYKQPGQSSYTGVERNSVTSSSYGSWGSSFSFRQTIPDRSITCTTTARDARFTSQNSFAVTCPSGCVQSDGNIWGSAVYTHDSSICRAVIHDGRLTDNGGDLTVFRQPGQSSYTGIERNSITSSSYGAWDSSFTFTSEIPNGFSIICTTTARDARFTSLTSFEVTCPSGCVESSGSLWGNVVYTHDSSICRAAIHDGRLNDSGGEITVYKQPGQSSYTGVERNSVTSSSYGSWGSSFSFRQTIPDRSLTCTTTARDARFTSQNSFEVTCPSGCVQSDGNIWGSAVYTHDSSICRAAIHDGRLTDNGGDLTVFRQPGQSSYTGIERKSITSSSYGAWDSSFTFTSEIPNGFSIICTTTARDARFTSLTSFEVTCPSGCVESSGSLWGNVVYTHDSSICRAAIHDGRLNDSGGEITVYKQPGQSSYTGVERNSVTSSSYGSWGSSFSFRQTIPDRSITCTTTARDARFTSQNSFAVTCPSGCVQSDGNIWGSAVYTHDSSICRAAIHDGRLTDNGGVLTVFRQSGQSSYTGIERNSITSSSYGAWDSSFTFTSEIPNGFSIICTTTARDARFTSLTSFEVTCPSGCVESSGSLWGNVVYTHDSSICRAAIHDGRLNDSGGEITVYKQPGQSSYTGVERNSVTSSSYGSWGSSFSFRQTIPDRSITCTTTARDARFTSQNSFAVTCPSGCVQSDGNIWGSAVYTHDSSICRAVIHDGRLTDNGGDLTVFRQPGQSSYTGIERNSITSSSYGAWDSSFTFTSEIPNGFSIICTTTARDARFTSLTSFEVTCPSGCVESSGSLWGNVVYTHDSSICRAAIHDGRLNDSGGEITVYKQPGQSSYTGVERNSVTSSSYGSWGSSFSFRQTIPDRSLTCTTTARDARFTSQNSFEVTCPSGCVQSDGNIWGSAVYTHDSSICRAAIHDGRLTDNGGDLTVFRQPGQSSYTGIERKSITSSSYGAWDSSFTFTSEIPNGFSIICTTTARDARFTSLTSFEVTCPSGCVESSGSLWGNVVYTHDSSICRAAIHDGRLNDSGGEITVYKQPGQSSYTGVERNSVTSSSYGSWGSSFSFTQTIPATSAQANAVTSSSNARDSRFASETVSFEVFCPSGCLLSSAAVWGTGVYTDDSAICRAAIHLGAITNSGGKVVVYVKQGQKSYTGSMKNGITSRSYGSWLRSFKIG